MNDLDAKFIRFRTVGGANCDCSDTDHQMCWASKYCQKQKSASISFFSSVGWEILPPPSTNSDRVGGFPASHIPPVTSDIMMGRTAVKLEMMQCLEMLAESRWSQWSERWDKVWSVATSEQFVASFSLLSTYLIINPRMIIMINIRQHSRVILPLLLDKLEIEKYCRCFIQISALHCLSGGWL